jgi:hypothetical protein
MAVEATRRKAVAWARSTLELDAINLMMINDSPYSVLSSIIINWFVSRVKMNKIRMESTPQAD